MITLLRTQVPVPVVVAAGLTALTLTVLALGTSPGRWVTSRICCVITFEAKFVAFAFRQYWGWARAVWGWVRTTWWWLRLGRLERKARRAHNMPMTHPERYLRRLNSADEGMLAALSVRTWPYAEYAQIIRELGEGL